MTEKTVRDVMLPLEEYATVRVRSTVREALVALDKAQMGLHQDRRHHHRAILVLDESGQVVGKLSHWALLRCLEPKLLSEQDLASLSRFGLSPEFIQAMVDRLPVPEDSLDALCAASSRIRVEDAMVPARESISDAAPLSEAIRHLVLSHVQSMLVTRGGRVVGVLRLSDVFEEIADRIRAMPS